MPVSPQDIDAILSEASGAYGANRGVLENIGRLESGFRDVVNDWDVNAKNGTPSAGWFQFIEPTYKSYSAQARKANPGAWNGVNDSWRDPRAQALTTAWAIANGKGSAWATYQRALKAAGTNTPTGPRSAAQAQAAAPASTYGLTTGRSATASLFKNDDGTDSFLSGFLDRRARRAPAAPAQAAPAAAVAAPAKGAHGAGLSDYKDLLRLGTGMGLRIDGSNQTTGGKHAPGSLHYAGEAVDFGDAKNDPAKLRQLAAYVRSNPGQYREFFYDPLGWYVKDGKIIKGAIGGHGDHVHAATY